MSTSLIWHDGEEIEVDTASLDLVDPNDAYDFSAVRSVSKAQALMALHKVGLLAQVRAAVAAHDLEEVRIWFDNANEWRRDNPYVQALSVELGLNDEAVSALFLAASLEG